MTGTETFAVLSTEDLDQVLGGGMVWVGDSDNWPYPSEFSSYLNPSSLNNYATTRSLGYPAG